MYTFKIKIKYILSTVFLFFCIKIENYEKVDFLNLKYNYASNKDNQIHYSLDGRKTTHYHSFCGYIKKKQ